MMCSPMSVDVRVQIRTPRVQLADEARRLPERQPGEDLDHHVARHREVGR